MQAGDKWQVDRHDSETTETYNTYNNSARARGSKVSGVIYGDGRMGYGRDGAMGYARNDDARLRNLS